MGPVGSVVVVVVVARIYKGKARARVFAIEPHGIP